MSEVQTDIVNRKGVGKHSYKKRMNVDLTQWLTLASY
jgi:hypothetical protein